MKAFMLVLAIIVFLLLGVWWQVSVWNECRETNSFWYCMRIISK